MAEGVQEVRMLLVAAQEPLILWLRDAGNAARAIALVRQCLETDQERDADRLLVWLAESENMQAAFRRIRARLHDERVVAPYRDMARDAERVRDALVASAEMLVVWLHKPENENSLLQIACEVGETVNVSRILERLRDDRGHALAQRVFQGIRMRMMGGRPVSLGSRDDHGNDLAGLAAFGSL